MPEIVHWNPRRRLRAEGPLWHVPLPGRVNNFGDLIGPWIVDRMCHRLGLGGAVSNEQRLLTVGSIINVAAVEGDVVWGSGIHGNHLPLRRPLPNLDVRAVRGPFTAAVLRESGCPTPDVYGDPALLIPHLWSDADLGIHRGTGGTVLVPNLHDLANAPRTALNPRGDLVDRIRVIASANFVIASSLHGIIVAEAYGVPTVVVAPGNEKRFKYQDYFGGTGRKLPPVARDWQSARHTPVTSPIDKWDATALIEAFPRDLWHPVEPDC